MTQSKGIRSESDVPPPMDPFPTYQTPYPRASPDNDNPFISFRRFADEQFSSFFSGLPSLLGIPQTPADNKDLESSTARLERQLEEQAVRFEAELAEMIRKRSEEAEGFRKQMEQEWEERRMENERRMQEENTKWDMLERGFNNCPGLQSSADPNLTAEMTETDDDVAEARSMQRRDLLQGTFHHLGLQRQRREPHSESEEGHADAVDTELDLYERFRTRRADRSRANRCPWKDARSFTWLSDLGWDGKQKAKNTALYVKDDVSTPFDDDYVATSEYSPLHLLFPWCSGDDRDTHRPNVPFMNDALKLKMAERLPWHQAFLDLVILENTGTMPERPYPDESDLVQTRATAHPLQYSARERNDANYPSPSTGDAVTGISLSTLLPALGLTPATFERGSICDDTNPVKDDSQEVSEPQGIFGARGASWPAPDAVISMIQKVKNLEIESQGAEESGSSETQLKAPATRSWFSSSSSTSSYIANDSNSTEGLVSTLTTTHSKTMPDGTVEIKKTLKRRFADGREECDESLEVRPVVLNRLPCVAGETQEESEKSLAKKQVETPSQIVTNARERGRGWFWN